MSVSATNGAGRHAVVIGGGIAGLSAARVLSDHFERVTVLERDAGREGGEPRKGAPQGRHTHILLIAGARAFEQLFPGHEEELMASGAPLADIGHDMHIYYPFGLLPRRAMGLSTRLASRSLREQLIRRRIDGNPRIRLREGVSVKGLVREGRGVSGVRLRAREGACDETLFADLVVVASGRESPVLEWLAEIGCPAPREEIVDAYLSYSTRWYRAPKDGPDFRIAYDLPGPPERRRGGVAMECEGGKWVVTLIGTAKERTPMTEEGFHAWLRGLRLPHLFELVQKAEPITPIYGAGRTENRWRHFEDLRMPDRLVVLGDAVSAFNPMYGQGMTMAAIGAMELGEALREQREIVGGSSLTGLSRRFQRRLAQKTGAIWAMSTGEDFRWSETQGDRPGPATRLFHSYFDLLTELAVEDAQVHETLLRVQHVLEPATSLFKPAIVSRVIERATRGAVSSLMEQVAR